jgi:hypothetical protein
VFSGRVEGAVELEDGLGTSSPLLSMIMAGPTGDDDALWWHRLRHMVVPHWHDSGAKVDPVLESSRDGLAPCGSPWSASVTVLRQRHLHEDVS